MRAYARERLTARGDLDRTARAHAEWAAERVAELNDALDRARRGPGHWPPSTTWSASGPTCRAAVTLAVNRARRRPRRPPPRPLHRRSTDPGTGRGQHMARRSPSSVPGDPRPSTGLQPARDRRASLDWRAGRFDVDERADRTRAPQLREAGFEDPRWTDSHLAQMRRDDRLGTRSSRGCCHRATAPRHGRALRGPLDSFHLELRGREPGDARVLRSAKRRGPRDARRAAASFGIRSCCCQRDWVRTMALLELRSGCGRHARPRDGRARLGRSRRPGWSTPRRTTSRRRSPSR